MCNFDVAGLPESSPKRCASFFWSSLSRSSCLRKKTTPRCETVWSQLLLTDVFAELHLIIQASRTMEPRRVNTDS